MEYAISTRWLEIQMIEVVATSFIIFGACLNIITIVKVKILVLVKWSYRFPGFVH